jgi:C1A family cysteine protease
MLRICLLLAFVVMALAALSPEERQFQDFIAKYHKSYTPSEYQTRFNIFKDNLAVAAANNAKSSHATFGVTKFMDLSKDEFKEQYLIKNFTHRANFERAIKYVAPRGPRPEYPASFDWNNQGVVTPVYNQGQCGSCWAFSTTENIESMWALAGNSLTQLSMQQIVDCDNNDAGCNGGNPPTAYQYVIDAGGMDSYASYPYLGYQGQCQFDPSNVVATISNWQWITQDDNENNMQSFVASYGPPSICVDAELWQTWNGGVVTQSSGCGNSLDHCVQLTGWSQMQGMNVWNVRNSWGADWGPYNGYIYLEMGYDVCGIGQEVTSSII